MKSILTSFRRPAIIAMLLTTAVATVANARLAGTGFWNWRGLPFKWYEAHDFGPPFHHYHWWALAADIIVGAAVVLAVGIVVEGLSRYAQSHPHKTA